jgi:DNA methylase/ParB/Sulfiredoxin domain
MSGISNSREPRLIPIESVKPYDHHARRHSKAKIEKLKTLLRHYGQIAPIVVDEDNVIISGHALHGAMRELGANEIAAVSIVGRSQGEIAALRIALNRLPIEAAWDNEKLRAEFQELVELSFNLELTGFDPPEIDQILDLDLPTANVVENEEQIPPVEARPVTKLGDIWTCGGHRVGCGSAQDGDFIAHVRNGIVADVCFVDPPYGVPITDSISGNSRNHHREFVHGSGEMSSDDFIAFLAAALKTLQMSSSPNALIYACADWRHVYELLCAGRQSAVELVNICVWTKTNAGTGALYRNQHELVCLFQAGSDRPANKIKLSRHGRNRSNVWRYAGLGSFGGGRDEPALHPAVKPVAMIADALRDVTKCSGMVLDTFVGAGSTVIAAEETGRHCFGIELDPLYVDVAIRRWQTRTHRDAVHSTTGELFCDRAERLLSNNEEAQHDQ